LNSPFDDQSPYILPDESGIIFSSNRDGSHELRTERGIAVSRDLYFARKTSSGWAAPELLPDEVNTAMIEENPFMHGKRLFFVRYPFAHPELAKIYFSDISEAGWSQAREFPVSAITPGVFGNRFYFARTSENGKYQIAFIPLGDLNLPNLADRIQVRQDLDTDADEASYAAAPDNAVVVFCRRSSTGDYDLFELRGDPWELGEAFSLTGILFDSNKATILPASGELLDRLAAYLKQKQTGILVTGHADRTGDAALNMSLSARRAESVKAALISRGVPAARIRTEGKGATEPVDPSNTEEAYAKNRRTEFRFIDN
jgi:outer membrane protein OmpA-like peptidoglycan-associated protein